MLAEQLARELAGVSVAGHTADTIGFQQRREVIDHRIRENGGRASRIASMIIWSLDLCEIASAKLSSEPPRRCGIQREIRRCCASGPPPGSPEGRIIMSTSHRHLRHGSIRSKRFGSLEITRKQISQGFMALPCAAAATNNSTGICRVARFRGRLNNHLLVREVTSKRRRSPLPLALRQTKQDYFFQGIALQYWSLSCWQPKFRSETADVKCRGPADPKTFTWTDTPRMLIICAELSTTIANCRSRRLKFLLNAPGDPLGKALAGNR